MRILLLQCDVGKGALLQRGIESRGHTVEVAPSSAVRRLVFERYYDLVIIGADVEEATSFSVLEFIRSRKDYPVLMLAMSGGLARRLRGLQLGAYDHLQVPVPFSRFMAVIDSVPVRCTRESGLLKLGDLEVDLGKQLCARGHARLILSRTEYGFLRTLVLHSGKIVSRETLAAILKDAAKARNSNYIDVVIYRLRNKLDGPFDEPLLHTVRGQGFVLESRQAK
jgi:two-component system copper resistance phosphate regulon response regulator CusR